MYLSRLVAIVACAATIIGCIVLSAAHAAEPTRCFKIVQHSVMCGDIEITVDATAMKVALKNQNALLVCKAPDWNVYKYNLSTKRFYTTSVEKFHNNFSQTRYMMGGQTFSDVTVKLVGPRRRAGFIENVYATGDDHVKKSFAMYKAHECSGSYPLVMEISGLVTNNCSAQELRVLKILNCLPKISELALSATAKGIDNKPYAYLETSKLTEEPVAADTFALPADFKKVASDEKLNDEKTVEGFADFFSDTPKKK